MSYQSEIENLLIDLDIKSATWEGALRFIGSSKTLAWEVDFEEWDGHTFGVRSYIPNSPTRKKLEKIIEIFHKMHCVIGTTIYIEEKDRIPKNYD